MQVKDDNVSGKTTLISSEAEEKKGLFSKLKEKRQAKKEAQNGAASTTDAITTSTVKLASTTYLSDLINAGADAQTNLFRVSFRNNSLDNTYTQGLQVRVQNFTAPSIESTTQDFFYQNTKITKALPSSNLNRTIMFRLRIDQDYLVYQGLKSTLCIDSKGSFDLNPESAWTISVDALKSGSSSDPYPISNSWIFYECYLINLGNTEYSYTSADALVIPATFVYKYFDVLKASSISDQDIEMMQRTGR